MLEVPFLAIPSWVPLRTLVVLLAVLASVLVVFRTGDRRYHPFNTLRQRLVLGIPWGTVLTVVGIIGVYLFVQGGIEDLRDPLVLPFRSWSYFYPLGVLTAAFSHSSLGHVTGNLIGTIVFAPIVEYAWGHYPRRRGSHSFSSWLTNPFVRILIFTVVVLVVGLFTSVFALGPVIGFSGVVFAFAGFAIVKRPLVATLAILANRVLGLVVRSIRDPRTVAVPRPRVITPWWADVAIQGHAIGLLAGILLAFGLAYYRDRWPDPARLWFGLLAFTVAQGLWALYLPQGSGRFVMFRWAGTALVFLLVGIAVIALSGNYPDYEDLPSVSLPFRRSPAELDSDSSAVVLPISAPTVALVFLLVITAGLSGTAIPYNVAPVGDESAPGPAIEIRDYSIGYAEDVRDGYVSSVQIPFVGNPTDIDTSGVIVTSERRHVWQTVVLKQKLANDGRAHFEVGGIGWRRSVYVNRTGWKPAGNESVYKVYLRPSGEERTQVFRSDLSQAEPMIAGRNVSVRATDETFDLVVFRNGGPIDHVAIPGNNETATAGGLTFVRNDSRVIVRHNDTRVPVAKKNN